MHNNRRRSNQKDDIPRITMIEHLLHPLVSERFSNDAHYRDGHLRVINALPDRRVLGLHTPEMKQIAKQLSRSGGSIILPNGKEKLCSNGDSIIRSFENTPEKSLCYEETVIWGFLINQQKYTLCERLTRLSRYVPIIDNWAVCDSYCANAKWMAQGDKETLWEFLQQYFLSEREFEVRFAIVVAMTYFLNKEWIEIVFKRIESIPLGNIKSEYKTAKGKPKIAQQGTVQGIEPYYVRMSIAWLLATALAKFPEETRKFANSSTLPQDIIKLYIRKARESFRTRSVEAL